MLLKKGLKGYAVESLQEMLKQLGYYSQDITGLFDNRTEEAVRWFQENNQLDATGIADDRTQLILAMRAAVVEVTSDKVIKINGE